MAQGMNFEGFKERYKAKLKAAGFEQPETQEEQVVLDQQIAAIYMGLAIYNDYQIEIQQEHEAEAKRRIEKAKQPGIILPGGGRLH